MTPYGKAGHVKPGTELGEHPTKQPSPGSQLTLGTGAFALCFAVFGSLSAMMPMLSRQMHLTPVQKSMALAVPVLLGSLGRIPLGMLTDHFGGRIVFSVVMFVSMVAAFLMGTVQGYPQLIGYGLLIGIGLASFSAGAGFVSNWYPAARQGSVLGIYGVGNIGQSLAAFGAPLIAVAIGIRWGFWIFGILLAAWLAIFVPFARNSPTRTPVRSLGEALKPLRDKRSWTLSLYYFLTFGGFVAMSVYLPIFLTETFGLTPQAAGFRTAGFIVLATATRPIGGALADRVGGRAILKWVFPLIAFFSIFLGSHDIVMPHTGAVSYMLGNIPAFERHDIVIFRIGALGIAAVIGLGSGAVFKLVPESFPKSVGSVTGIVGAAGGLGGFFPPLVLGAIREETGSFTLGFVLLGIFSLICFAVLLRSTRRRAPARQIPK